MGIISMYDLICNRHRYQICSPESGSNRILTRSARVTSIFYPVMRAYACNRNRRKKYEFSDILNLSEHFKFRFFVIFRKIRRNFD